MNKEQLESIFDEQLEEINRTCSILEDDTFKLKRIFKETLKLLEEAEVESRALKAYIEIKNGKEF